MFQHYNTTENVTEILIGCKCELENREVSYHQAFTWACDNDMMFLEVSAKDKKNMQQLMYLLKDKTLSAKIRTHPIIETHSKCICY